MDRLKNIVPEHFRSLEEEFALDLLYGYGIKTNIDRLIKIQVGGVRTEYQKFIDIGVSRETESLCSKGIYTYEINIEEIDSDRIRISIVTPNGQDCVTVLIFKSDRIAELHNMSYFDNCAMEGLSKPGGGNKLLRFALNLLMKWKDDYGIARIILKDNSFLYCVECSENIKLSQLRLITHGKTWYESYGFRPYDELKRKPSSSLLKSMDTTKRILKGLKTTDIDTIKLVSDVIKKESLEGVDIDEMKRLVNNYPVLRDFIIRLSREMGKYCCIIMYVLKVIYNPETRLGLTDFYRKSFYLDI